MKVKLLTLILVLQVLTCWTQQVKDLAVMDRFTINTDSFRVIGNLASYNKETAVKLERTYYWFAGGKIQQTQGSYQQRLLDGDYLKSFELNKQIAEKGTFKKGLKSGKWNAWALDGQLKANTKYCKGFKQGYEVIYTENGMPSKKTHYNKGLKNGKEFSYEKDKWQPIGKYKNNQSIELKEPIYKRWWNAIFNKNDKKASSPKS